jgi:hypothetical protein
MCEKEDNFAAQETHAVSEENLRRGGTVPGFLQQRLRDNKQYAIESFLANFIGVKSSRWRRLNNGLPQGIILVFRWTVELE